MLSFEFLPCDPHARRFRDTGWFDWVLNLMLIADENIVAKSTYG